MTKKASAFLKPTGRGMEASRGASMLKQGPYLPQPGGKATSPVTARPPANPATPPEDYQIANMSYGPPPTGFIPYRTLANPSGALEHRGLGVWPYPKAWTARWHNPLGQPRASDLPAPVQPNPLGWTPQELQRSNPELPQPGGPGIDASIAPNFQQNFATLLQGLQQLQTWGMLRPDALNYLVSLLQGAV